MTTRKRAKPGTGARASRPNLRFVFLMGFMGAGKSSVGRALAKRLGWAFEDLDERIEASEGRTIDQIFRESGEAEFRRIEERVLHGLLNEAGSAARVVALGGGTFAQTRSAALVRRTGGTLVFLDAEVEELFERCQKQDLDRPLLQSLPEFRQLYRLRRPLYAKADRHIKTDGKDVNRIVAELIGSLAGTGSRKGPEK